MPPTTYAEWIGLLDKFTAGDDAVMDMLMQGSFTLDAGTAVRFCKSVDNAYEKRKKMWLEKFNRSLQQQACRTESDFELLLRNAKQNLQPLQKFICIKAIPVNLQQTFKKDLEDFISEIRKSLKDSVSKTFTAKEKILLLLNSFGLQGAGQMPAIGTQSNNEATAPAGRKIIF